MIPKPIKAPRIRGLAGHADLALIAVAAKFYGCHDYKNGLRLGRP